MYSRTYIEFLVNILEKCRGIEQNEFYHPEGDVLNHSLQALYIGLRRSNDIELIFAAMLHDVGKYFGNNGHENYSVEILEDYVSEKTLWLIKNHMQICYLLTRKTKKLKRIKTLYNNVWFKELILLAIWDKMARNPNRQVVYNKEKLINDLVEKVNYAKERNN